MTLNYPLHIEADDKGYLVTCPDLPEVTSDGETVDEAVANGADAVAEALAGRLSDGAPIPRPSDGLQPVSVPPRIEWKTLLYWALVEQNLTKADLANLLGWGQSSVDRLFDPKSQNSYSQFENAHRAIYESIVVKSAGLGNEAS